MTKAQAKAARKLLYSFGYGPGSQIILDDSHVGREVKQATRLLIRAGYAHRDPQCLAIPTAYRLSDRLGEAYAEYIHNHPDFIDY